MRPVIGIIVLFALIICVQADEPPGVSNLRPLRRHEHGWFDGKRSPNGEWCCGEGDCAVLDADAVKLLPDGYHVNGRGTITLKDGVRWFEEYHEIVPESEAQPSQDGQYWRCRRADKVRRCFFAPPPST